MPEHARYRRFGIGSESTGIGRTLTGTALTSSPGVESGRTAGIAGCVSPLMGYNTDAEDEQFSPKHGLTDADIVHVLDHSIREIDLAEGR